MTADATVPSRRQLAAVWVLRIAVGAVFVVSGISKIIDPYGTLYKMEQYFAAWHLNVPYGVTLLGGCLLSLVEFITGWLLATGSMRRASVGAACAIMAVMTPLSLYIAIANPVDHCGCFGDLWVIGNTWTFVKNLVITAALVPLWRMNAKAPYLFHPLSQWLQILIAAAYACIVGLTGYHEQPLIDFRPYPAGTPLVADTDLSAAQYRYRNTSTGAERIFTADALPDETDGWEFVERIDNATSNSSSTFTLTDDEGHDVTDMLGATHRQLLVLIPDLQSAGLSSTYIINELAEAITASHGDDAMLCAVAGDDETVNRWLDLSRPVYPVVRAEATAMRTVARGSVAVVCLTDGVVTWKRNINSINLDRLDGEHTDWDAYSTNEAGQFATLTWTALLLEALLCLISYTSRLIHTFLTKSAK